MRRLPRGELRTAAEAASRLLRSPTLFSDSPEIVGFRLPEAYGGATPVAILQVLVFETLANMTKALLREEDPAAESIPLLTLIIKTAEGSGLRSDALRALERDWRVRHYGVSGPVRQSRAEIQKSPVRLRNVITVERRRIVARTTIPDQKAGGSNPSGRTGIVALTKNFAKPRSPGWVFLRGPYGRISMILTILFLINWSVLAMPGRDHAQLNVPLGAFP